MVYDHAKAAIRPFAVERINNVATTKQRFVVKEDLDFEAFTRTTFPIHGGEPQLVRIRFSPDQAPYIMELQVGSMSEAVGCRGGDSSFRKYAATGSDPNHQPAEVRNFQMALTAR